MTDQLAQIRGWSMAQQCLTAPAATLLEALRAVVGVYSAHPSAPLSLYVRSRNFTAAEFRQLEIERLAVRIPAMRTSIFLVPTTNAGRIFAAMSTAADKRVRRVAGDEQSLADYRRLTPQVLAATEQPRTASQLANSVNHPKLGTNEILRMLTYEGLLLRIGAEKLRSDILRYVDTSKWLDQPLVISRDGEAAAAGLAWLAGEYLRAFGPARVADFAWWAGVPQGQARRAVAAHQTIDVGDGLLLHAADEAAFAKAQLITDSVVLLPKWDAYTMGYAPDGRARFVHPDVQAQAYAPVGDGNPLVLVDGQCVGTWSLMKGAELKLELFDTLAAKTRARIEEQAALIRGLLDEA